jgi:hypothetical protein
MSLLPCGDKDVWDVLHETAQAHALLAEYVRARLAAAEAELDHDDSPVAMCWTVHTRFVPCESGGLRLVVAAATDDDYGLSVEIHDGKVWLVSLDETDDRIAMHEMRHIRSERDLLVLLRALGVEVKGGAK